MGGGGKRKRTRTSGRRGRQDWNLRVPLSTIIGVEDRFFHAANLIHSSSSSSSSSSFASSTSPPPPSSVDPLVKLNSLLEAATKLLVSSGVTTAARNDHGGGGGGGGGGGNMQGETLEWVHSDLAWLDMVSAIALHAPSQALRRLEELHSALHRSAQSFSPATNFAGANEEADNRHGDKPKASDSLVPMEHVLAHNVRVLQDASRQIISAKTKWTRSDPPYCTCNLLQVSNLRFRWHLCGFCCLYILL